MSQSDATNTIYTKLFQGHKSYILSQSQIVRLEDMRDWDESVEQHFQGIQRIGVMPCNALGMTKFAVLKFGVKAHSPTIKPLAQAVSVQSFLSDWSGSRVITSKVGTRTKKVSVSRVSSYIFRGPSLVRESYDVVLFFSVPTEVFRIWALLRALLIGLKLEKNCDIVPRPAVPRVIQASDFYLLPLFTGDSDLVNGEPCGGIKQQLTTLTICDSPDVTLISDSIRERVAKVSAAKIRNLEILLDDYMDGAFRDAKLEIDAMARLTEIGDKTEESAMDLEDSESPESRQIIVQIVDKGTGRGPEVDQGVDYSLLVSADHIRIDIVESVARWKEMPWQVLSVELDIWLHSWIPLISPYDLEQCLKYVASELNIEYANLLADARNNFLRSDLSFTGAMRLVEMSIIFELKGHQIGSLCVRWLVSHGGEFAINDHDECVLTYNGNNYIVAERLPFKTLLWELLGGGNSSVTLEDIWVGVECEANSYAGRSGQPVSRPGMSKEEYLLYLNEKHAAQAKGKPSQ